MGTSLDGSRHEPAAVQIFVFDPAMIPSPRIGGIIFISCPDVPISAR
jgi:hypothetical protein